jgi:hypothetical protein
MLLPLLAVLAGLAITPLTTSEVAVDARSIVQTLDIGDMNISIRELRGSDHPSPLLVKHSKSKCTILVNTGTLAHATWDTYMGEAEGKTAEAMRDFAVAHEIGHCIVSDLRLRAFNMPVLTSARGSIAPATPKMGSVTEAAMLGSASRREVSVKIYDEFVSDLVGLRLVQLAYPGEFETVRQRIRGIRKTFAENDPEHDSSEFLNERNLAIVARLIDEHDAR